MPQQSHIYIPAPAHPDVLEQSVGQHPHGLVDDPVQGRVGSLCSVFAALWVALPAALHERSTGFTRNCRSKNTVEGENVA